jgi:hypothetical protein
MRSDVVPKGAVPDLTEDGVVVFEEKLPFPYVNYPSHSIFDIYHGFQEHENSPLYFCSCQKKSLQVYLSKGDYKLFNIFPRQHRRLAFEQFFDQFLFKEKLCHVCNKVAPHFGYGKTTDNTKFASIYGRYINAKAYEYGIDLLGRVIDPNLIPEDILPYLITREFDFGRLDEESVKDFMRYCENEIRVKMDYFKIGEKWTSEIQLLQFVKKIFPNYTVIHQYDLDGLKADIFIEELDLVIEYQGQQHFKAISAWGGEEGLQKTQERDALKVEICEHYKLDLVYFRFDEELTEKTVKAKLTTYLTKTK